MLLTLLRNSAAVSAATIRGFASASNSVFSSGTLTINASSLSVAPVAGDLLLAFINYNNADNNNAASFAATTPTGWTVGKAVTAGSSGSDWVVVYKRTATASTADNFVLNYDGDGSGLSNDITGIVVTIQNAGTPTFGSVASGTFVTSLAIPSVGSTGDLLLVNAGNFNGVAYTTAPSGMTAVTSRSSNGSIVESSILYQQTLGTPGTRTVASATGMYVMGIGVSVPYVPAGSTLTASASLVSTLSVAASATATFSATAALTSTPSPAATGTPTLTASATLTSTFTPAATGTYPTSGLTWGGISLWSSPPTWDYTSPSTATVTTTPSTTATGLVIRTATATVTTTPIPAAAALVVQTPTATVTTTPTTTAGYTLIVSRSATLTVTPTMSIAAFLGNVASASLTVTPVVAAQGTTAGTITPVSVTTASLTPITIPGATIIPSTPITTAYWSSFALWSSPYTYSDRLGSATITPVGV